MSFHIPFASSVKEAFKDGSQNFLTKLDNTIDTFDDVFSTSTGVKSFLIKVIVAVLNIMDKMIVSTRSLL